MQPLQYSQVKIGAQVTPAPARFVLLTDATRMIHSVVYVITDQNINMISSNYYAFLLVQEAPEPQRGLRVS